MERLVETAVQKAIDNGGVGLWIVIFFAIIGVIIYGLKKNGVITFGGFPDRRRCPVETCPNVEGVIIQMAEHKKEIKEHENRATQNLTEIKVLIRDMDLRIDQKLDENFKDIYDLLREYAKKLDNHIGFCEGIQSSKVRKQ